MISLYETGTYQLAETKRHVKILSLGKEMYAWLGPKDIGDMLVLSKHTHIATHTLSLGHYRLYHVTDEPGVADWDHLELEVGGDIWQGYLLLTGLPTSSKKRSRIVPTKELIAHNPAYLGPYPAIIVPTPTTLVRTRP